MIGHINGGFNEPPGVAFSPTGSYAYITNYGSSNVMIVNTSTSNVVSAITLGFSSPIGVAFAPSGAYAYVVNYGTNNVVIINTATNTVSGSITAGISGPYGVAFAPSGAYAYVANYGVSNVVIVSTLTSAVVGSVAGGFIGPVGISFMPSGTSAYVTNWGASNVVVVNTAASSVTSSVTGGFNHPYGVALAPFFGLTGNYFATAMGSLNLKSYNNFLFSNFSNDGLVSINETRLKVQQENPFLFYISYLENVKINQTYGVSNFSLPVNITVSGLTYYVPITLTNSQTSNTGGGFQQMLNVNSLKYYPYINSNWSNVEFTTGNDASGYALQAWVESNAVPISTNTVVWVRVSNGIASSSSNTIYMNFMPYSVMSAGGPTGEAPQLSVNYGEFDNGASVFVSYANFAGTTIASSETQWTEGSQINQNNGVILNTSPANGGAARDASLVVLVGASGYPTPIFFEADIASFTGSQGGISEETSTNPHTYAYMMYDSGGSVGLGNAGGFPGGSNIPTLQLTTGIMGEAWTATGTERWYRNYAETDGSDSSVSLPVDVYPTIAIAYQAPSSSISVQWARLRIYPPNDVMPSAAYGNLV